MPEGDTIYRAARTLHRALAGKPVVRFETALAQLSRFDDQQPIAGRTIENVSARGKHLIMSFSGGLTMRTHMRMNGSWHIYRPGERWQRPRRDMRVVIETADFVAVGFNLPVAEFLTDQTLGRQRDLRLIGPDLLGDQFDFDEAVRRLQSRPALTMAEALLNQRLVAGIGNVYKSETLFLARVHPFATVSSVGGDKLLEVLEVARKLMRYNVLESTGEAIVTYTGFRRTTRRSDPSDRLWVYGRKDKPCRKCGAPIAYAKKGLDARSTYWCPTCQSPA